MRSGAPRRKTSTLSCLPSTCTSTWAVFDFRLIVFQWRALQMPLAGRRGALAYLRWGIDTRCIAGNITLYNHRRMKCSCSRL